MMLKLGPALCLLQISCLIFTTHSRVSRHRHIISLSQSSCHLSMNQLATVA